MFQTLHALVLREVRYKEADRILTLLTDTEGKLTVKARGALRKSSRIAAATQQLTYAEMTLFGNRGRWTVNEAVVLESFDGLRGDMEKLALGSYFAECTEALSVEDQPEPELLQLALNCLFALSRGLHPPEKIKAAFETRLMCISGYAPELTVCAVCGREPEDPALSLDHGCVCCRACGGMGERADLGEEGLAALRYLASAPAKKLLAFTLSDGALPRLADASERYFLRRAERGFSTLKYWKSLRAYGNPTPSEGGGIRPLPPSAACGDKREGDRFSGGRSTRKPDDGRSTPSVIAASGDDSSLAEGAVICLPSTRSHPPIHDTNGERNHELF